MVSTTSPEECEGPCQGIKAGSINIYCITSTRTTGIRTPSTRIIGIGTAGTRTTSTRTIGRRTIGIRTIGARTVGTRTVNTWHKIANINDIFTLNTLQINKKRKSS